MDVERSVNQNQAQPGTKAHENQEIELTKQLQLLKETQTKCVKVKEKLNEEVSLLNKKIVLFETSNNQIDLNNKNTQTGINNILRGIERKKQKIEQTEANYRTIKRKVLREEEKMSEYRERVETEREKKDIYKRALKEQDDIAAMKKRRDDILIQFDFDTTNLNIDDLTKLIAEIHSKIERNKKEKTKLTEEHESLKNKLSGMKATKTELEQEIKVIEKHNTARLLRLKCQLKKAQEGTNSKQQFN